MGLAVWSRYVAAQGTGGRPSIRLSRYRPCHRLLLCVCPILAIIAADAARAADRNDALLNFNFYPYLSRATHDTDFTLIAGATLPAGLSYSSFVNVGGVFHQAGARFVLSEQNLRWSFSPQIPLDVALQTQIAPGEGTDCWQVGPRWRVSETPLVRAFFAAIHASWSITFFERFDTVEGSVRQISHSFGVQFPYLSERLYLSGFFDQGRHHGGAAGRRHVVNTETQLGVRLVGKLYVIAEYRRNEYRASNKDNLAVGLELKSRW